MKKSTCPSVISLGMWLVLGGMFAFAQNAMPGQDVLRFDARWWHEANSAEQQGFIYGYMDCRQPRGASSASIVDYQTDVSTVLKSETRSRSDAVAMAIQNAWKTLKPRDIQGGENYGERHGFLDGEWWGEFEGKPWPSELAHADRGYLEGYLACAVTPVSANEVHHYQLAINNHYASGRHSHDKIAIVLKQLLRAGSLGK